MEKSYLDVLEMKISEGEDEEQRKERLDQFGKIEESIFIIANRIMSQHRSV